MLRIQLSSETMDVMCVHIGQGKKLFHSNSLTLRTVTTVDVYGNYETLIYSSHVGLEIAADLFSTLTI